MVFGVVVCVLQAAGKSRSLLTAFLVTHTSTVLPSHNKTVQKMFANILASRGIRVVSGKHVVAVRGRQIICDGCVCVCGPVSLCES